MEVRIKIQNRDLDHNKMLVDLNGTKAELARTKKLKKGTSEYWIAELKGIESPLGVPYTFARDWLTPVTVLVD